MALPRFPIGNLFQLTTSGILDSVPEPQQELELNAPILDPMVHGPNYVAHMTEETANPKTLYSPGSGPMCVPSSNGKSDRVDVGREALIIFHCSHTLSAPSPVALPHVLPLHLGSGYVRLHSTISTSAVWEHWSHARTKLWKHQWHRSITPSISSSMGLSENAWFHSLARNQTCHVSEQ